VPPYSDALRLLAEWDTQAVRTAHVGVLLPWANVAVEAELPRFGLRHVVFHYARLVPSSRTTAVDDAFWQGLREAAAPAMDSLSHIPLDGVLLACTSAGFTSGTPLPMGVVTAFDALRDSLRLLGAERVALGTPYPKDVTKSEVNALRRAGMEVTGWAALDLVDGYPGVTGDQIRRLVQEIPSDGLEAAQALVLSCTGWHSRALLVELQATLGKPVISSNLAMALYAARLATGARP
jgi:maleate isomerase